MGEALGIHLKGKIWWLGAIFVACLFGYLITHMPLRAEDQGMGYDTPSKNPVPRWVSIRSSKVYARKGPSADHPVMWSYTQKGLPVQIISETKEWRLICDPSGATAWVRHDMVSAKRSVMAIGSRPVNLYAQAKETAQVKALLKPMALANLDRCKGAWCKISIGHEQGYVNASEIWGVAQEPVCQRPEL